MYNLLKAEIYKLKYSKELMICLIGILILAIINTYYGSVDGGGRGVLSHPSRVMFGIIACGFFAATYVGKDLVSNTINHTLTCGHTRSQVFLSKYLCYLLGCTIILLANYILIGGMYSLSYGWGVAISISELYFVVVYVLMGIFFDLCISSISFFICILIKNSSISNPLCGGVIGLILAMTQIPWDSIAYYVANKDYSLGIVPFVFVGSFVLGTSILYLIGSYRFKEQDI
ncbi:MAG: ABC transporter permease subunit [Romboutsia sp.]|uniref:ABC transporter permease subunit n=1 Tax=Romboutsia sp. TaxID=1965302 RepID=UPI003F2C0768